MKVQEMEIQVGARCKADPFGVLVLCVQEKVVTAMNIWIPVHFCNEMGSECER